MVSNEHGFFQDLVSPPCCQPPWVTGSWRWWGLGYPDTSGLNQALQCLNCGMKIMPENGTLEAELEG